MTKAAEKIKELKTRLKRGLVVSGIALSGLSMSQNASATEQSKDKSEPETTKMTSFSNERTTDNNLYKHFYKSGQDDGIKIEPSALAQGLAAAKITNKSAEFKKFCDSYEKYMDKEGKITFWNFNQALGESLSPEQIVSFCNGLQKALDEPKAEQLIRTTDDNKNWQTIKKGNDVIQYAIGDDGISIKGEFNGNVSHIMPPVKKQKDGTYKCGPTTSKTYRVAAEKERVKLSTLMMEHFVYNDLISKGQTSGRVEKAFIERHKKDMAKHGVYTDKKGNLRQSEKSAINIVTASRSYE